MVKKVERGKKGGGGGEKAKLHESFLLKIFNTYELQTNTVKSQRFPILVKIKEFFKPEPPQPIEKKFSL